MQKVFAQTNQKEKPIEDHFEVFKTNLIFLKTPLGTEVLELSLIANRGEEAFNIGTRNVFLAVAADLQTFLVIFQTLVGTELPNVCPEADAILSQGSSDHVFLARGTFAQYLLVLGYKNETKVKDDGRRQKGKDSSQGNGSALTKAGNIAELHRLPDDACKRGGVRLAALLANRLIFLIHGLDRSVVGNPVAPEVGKTGQFQHWFLLPVRVNSILEMSPVKSDVLKISLLSILRNTKDRLATEA